MSRTPQTSQQMWECLEALDAANVSARLRFRAETGLGENDLAALEFLSTSHLRGDRVSPVDVTKHLGVSSASTTAILDRLEKRGRISRIPHPTDRRRVFIEPSADAAASIQTARDEAARRVAATFADLSPEHAEIIMQFLYRVRDAVDAPQSEPATPH